MKKYHFYLLLPLLGYLGVFLLWTTHGYYPLEGDEGKYVRIMEHMLASGDPAAEGTHRVGLPLLLLPGYALLGTTGARLLMTMWAGLFPFVGYRLLRHWCGEGASVILAVIVFGGFPYVFAANQIFPDLLAGLFLLFSVERLLALYRGETWSRLSGVGFAFAVAWLPWFHLKNTGAMLLLLAFYFFVRTRRRRPLEGLDWVPAAGVVVSLLLTPLYNFYSYGNLLGPWGVESLNNGPPEMIMYFLGLHWDQALGLFWHQPLFVLGLVGLGSLAKRSSAPAVGWLALYLSILGPNVSHGDYGGLSLYGRFHWSVVSLWLVPLGHLFWRLRRFRKTWLGVLGAAVLYQLYLARTLLVNVRLYYRYWLPDSLFPGALWSYLPRFTDPTRLWGFVEHRPVFYLHPPNYAVVLLSVLLLILGFLLAGYEGAGRPDPLRFGSG